MVHTIQEIVWKVYNMIMVYSMLRIGIFNFWEMDFTNLIKVNLIKESLQARVFNIIPIKKFVSAEILMMDN